jgi:hypothetical protein
METAFLRPTMRKINRINRRLVEYGTQELMKKRGCHSRQPSKEQSADDCQFFPDYYPHS